MLRSTVYRLRSTVHRHTSCASGILAGMRSIVFSLGLALFLAVVLAAFQAGDLWRGGLAFFLVLAPGMLAIRALSAPDKTMPFSRQAALASFLIRLALGLGLYLGLSFYGYPNEQERAGYLFTDAFNRDRQAWTLAQSERPLSDAFRRQFYADQYGGLLAISATLYRFLSPDAHRPLLVVALAAWVGALGVLYFGRIAARLLPEGAARGATWLFALYPEALFLGASQMREPFLLTFGAMMLFGALRQREDKGGFPWELGSGVIGLLLISPGTALAFGVALGFWFWLESGRRLPIWTWGALVGIILLGALIFALSVGGVSVRGGTFWEVIGEWARLSVRWSAYQLERSSGWVQKLFREMPVGFQLPFVAGYGILQPILPGAFVEPALPIRKAIAIVRATSWYALLPLLLFAFRAVWKTPLPERRRWMAFLILSWGWILIAALRGGGDQWDNPRYRLFFLAFQVLLAAYAWQQRDAWWRRVLWIEGFAVLIFFQWYLSRYYHIGGRLSFFAMIGLIFAFALLVLIGGWLWDRQNARTRGRKNKGREPS